MTQQPTRAAAPAPARQHGEPDTGRRPWATLGLMLLAQFMVILDVSVVNVALPSIGSALDFTSGDYQWVVSAYVLFSGGLLLLGGRLADLVDRRSIFLAGLVTFTLASLASGLAGSATTLIVARAAQGLGAAMLTPAALSIIMTAYTGKQRAAALSVWGAIGSTGIAAGVLFGGVLTSALGWQAVFFINVPIGVAVAGLTLRIVPAGVTALSGLRRLDLPGAATVVSGLVVLVYAIEGTNTHGWDSARTWFLLALGGALLTAFAVIERTVATPLVPPHAWRIRSLVSGSAVMAGVTGVVVGVIFLSSLYLQRVVGSSAVETGLQFLPLALAITLAAMVASKQLDRFDPRSMIAFGLVVMALGAFVMAQAGGTSYAFDVLPGFLLMGAGVGPMFVAISVVAMRDVPPAQSGLASGLMMTGHEVGAALGVAVLTVVGGDLTTRAGLVEAYPRSFTGVIVILGALLVLTLAAVPKRTAGTADRPALHH
ncbi:MAG TPA: MFS transporter [Nocardioidaceae bacterium]|nr:MFS transporter [Nocardioidaceae bacterium]